MYYLKNKKPIIAIILLSFIITSFIVFLILREENKGTLRIITSPDQALVFINGKEQSEKTPFVKRLVVGKYNIKITKQGYANYQREIEIKKGIEVKIEFDLTSFFLGGDLSAQAWEEEAKRYKNSPAEKLKTQWAGKVWGDNFSIEYYASTDEFYIDIGGANCKKCKQDALNWFKKRSVDPNNLTIIWLPKETPLPEIPPQETAPGE